MKRYSMYINGEWTDAADGSYFPVYDPSTENVIAEVPEATAADIAQAVAAARAAFDNGAWPATTAQERGRILLRLAKRVRKGAAELAELESRNSGKPIVEAEFDINDVATCFEYYGGLATKVHGPRQPCAGQRAESFPARTGRRRRPDHSLELSAADGRLEARACARRRLHVRPQAGRADAADRARVGALVFGCRACRRASSTSSPASARPPARRSCMHPDVNKIAFTGSAYVGKQIVKMAADTLKRVTLELGGKSPNIFFADADFEAAIDGALFGVFINQGEVCSAGSRILVERSIYPKFVEAMAEKAKRIKLGPPLERDTKMGPLVSKEQYERVRAYQELGKNEAKLAIGGGRPAASPAATTLSRPSSTTSTTQCPHRARGDLRTRRRRDPVHERSRGHPHRQRHALWPGRRRLVARHLPRFRVVKALRAGIVWVNHMQPTYVEAPWGGYKQSGFGRELGPWGIEEYLETKQVHINLNEQPIGWY